MTAPPQPPTTEEIELVTAATEMIGLAAAAALGGASTATTAAAKAATAAASTDNSTSQRAAAADDAKAKVRIGDDSHKLALVVAQHTSETAFGKNPGIGANHHVQHMYTDYYVRTNDKLNYAAMANTFMDNRKQGPLVADAAAAAAMAAAAGP